MLPAIEPSGLARLLFGEIGLHAGCSLGHRNRSEMIARGHEVIIRIRGVAHAEFDNIKVLFCPEPSDLRPVRRRIGGKHLARADHVNGPQLSGMAAALFNDRNVRDYCHASGVPWDVGFPTVDNGPSRLFCLQACEGESGLKVSLYGSPSKGSCPCSGSNKAGGRTGTTKIGPG